MFSACFVAEKNNKNQDGGMLPPHYINFTCIKVTGRLPH